MASPQEVNRQVALALRRVIIPLAKADCHTHAEGVTYLYGERDADGRMRLFRTVRLSTDGNSCIATDEFNPAESPGDALECLEEWAVQHKRSVKFWFDIGERTGRLAHVCIIEGRVAVDGETFCEAACQAIIHAEAGK
jgi:hypothetical protein